jgi:DNA-binding Xre family transcriptional regulator
MEVCDWAVRYNKLFKMLDKGLKKGELCSLANINKTSMAKLSVGKSISTSILEWSICLSWVE